MTAVADPSLGRAGHRRVATRAAVPYPALTALPLAVILVVQAGLSLRLLHATTASGDEAIYIYGGHQLIHELWHGGGSPYYETWFSGAPVIYPVFAAMLDHVGGLILVRLASLACMLTATALLYRTARRLFGYWPAVAAAGLFASLGITQSLGVYATYDAPALMVMAFAAYCAAREDGHARWLLAVPVVLLAANTMKYATILFDPVVIGLAALTLRPHGWRRTAERAAVLIVVTAVMLTVTILLAGTAYWHGIKFTTIARKAGTGILHLAPATPHQIISYSWSVIGMVVCLAAFAVVAALLRGRERQSVPLLAVLTGAGLLVTLEAIHLHDLTSVNKHDDFGAWFTCIPAGYAFARGAELVHVWWKRLGFVVGALASLAVVLDTYGASVPAGSAYGDASMFGPIAAHLSTGSPNRYLLGGRDSRVILYDYHLAIPWYREFDDDYIKYPIPGRGGNEIGTVPGPTCQAPMPGCMYLSGPAAARAAIQAHWFAVVSFVGQNGLSIDLTELAVARATPGYKLVSIVGGPTYIYAPDYPRSLGGTAR